MSPYPAVLICAKADAVGLARRRGENPIPLEQDPIPGTRGIEVVGRKRVRVSYPGAVLRPKKISGDGRGVPRCLGNRDRIIGNVVRADTRRRVSRFRGARWAIRSTSLQSYFIGEKSTSWVFGSCCLPLSAA